MADMNFERVKEINGWETGIELPDLRIGDCFLFEHEEDDAQGHIVVDILRVENHVLIQHEPEWTPVRSSSMHPYKSLKFRIKKLD